MGDVDQATDSKLGRSVAIKLLPEAFAQDHERAARFEREARVLASLNHPNIAAIHGIEESGGRKSTSGRLPRQTAQRPGSGRCRRPGASFRHGGRMARNSTTSGRVAR